MDRRNFIKAAGVGVAAIGIPINLLAQPKLGGKRRVERFRIHFGPINNPSKSYVWWEEIQMRDLREGEWFRMFEPDGTPVEYDGDTEFCATKNPEQVNRPGEHELWHIPGHGLSKVTREYLEKKGR